MIEIDIQTTKNNKLVIPKEELDKISGNKKYRISIVVTDPRSRHLILTREPHKHKAWYKYSLERGLDFIPTTVLEKAKIDGYISYKCDYKDGDLIIRRGVEEGNGHRVLDI